MAITVNNTLGSIGTNSASVFSTYQATAGSRGAISYYWQLSTSSGVVQTLPTQNISENTNATIVGSFSSLTPSTSYTATCYWTAAGGQGTFSGSIPFTTGAAPTVPNAMGTISVSSSSQYAPATITFSWSNPGGATSYDYSGSASGSTTSTSVNVQGNTAGLYSLTVTPRNSVGTGASKEGNITLQTAPPPQPPTGIPTVVAFSNPGGLTMTARASSSQNASGYRFYWYDPAVGLDISIGSATFEIVFTPSNSTYPPKEYYNYRIKAVPYNGAGEGPPNTVFARTADLTPPGSSGLWQATSVTSNSVTINAFGAFDTVPSNGEASGIAGYEVYYKQGNSSTGMTLWGTFSGQDITTTITGLQPATLYTIATKAYDVYGNRASDANRIVGPVTTKTLAPSAPTAARIDGGFSILWGSVSGATNYQIEWKRSASSLWSNKTSTTTSTTLNVGDYGFTWDFRVKAFVNGEWGDYSSTSSATTAPKVPDISGTYVGTTVTITMSGMGESNSQFDDVLVERRLISNNTVVDSKSIPTNGGNVQWTGLNSENVKLYKWTAYSRMTVNGTLIRSLSDSPQVVQFARPADFSWTYAGLHPTTGAIVGGSFKIQDHGFYVHNSEWNGLTSKINLFREYKGLGTFTFTPVSSGSLFYYNYFNEARGAIAEMSPPESPPGAKLSGQEISAADLNLLMMSLNSIL